MEGLLIIMIYIPSDAEKYILATSDFTKGIQTDINHYETKDNASIRQKAQSNKQEYITKAKSTRACFSGRFNI